MGLKKAPGPDGIPAEVVVAAARRYPEIFCRVFTRCIRDGEFPARWKEAELVLIRNGEKPPDQASSYRPICLIDHVWKLFERILLARLQQEIERTGGLANNQFGFRRGRSTIDALAEIRGRAEEAKKGTWRTRQLCVLITLDVRNAFNTVRWYHVLSALHERGIHPELRRVLDNYLRDRSLKARCGDGELRRRVSGGVPQGSVLGPTLWNVMYDGVLRLTLPDGTRIVGFADDLSLVVTARTEEALMRCADGALGLIGTWMEEKGLELAPQKSEAVIFSGRRRLEATVFRVGGHRIVPKRSLRCLGVELDSGGTFVAHLEGVAARAAGAVKRLTWLMPNVGGPKQGKRRLLGSVSASMILYSAEIWAGGLRFQKNRSKILAVQSQAALRAASLYRTVSTEAAALIAGMCPIYLLTRERY